MIGFGNKTDKSGSSVEACLKYVDRRKYPCEAAIVRYLSDQESKKNHAVTVFTVIPLPEADIIVMKAYSCSLQTAKSIPSPSLMTLARSLIEGLSFIHGIDVAHCDIKPANVVLSETPLELKIIDFSLALWLSGSEGTNDDYRGTKGWSAPEVGRGKYDLVKADIWSCGKVLAHMSSICNDQRDASPVKKVVDMFTTDDPQGRKPLTDGEACLAEKAPIGNGHKRTLREPSKRMPKRQSRGQPRRPSAPS
jgi:serine/threonine protein kinase